MRGEMTAVLQGKEQLPEKKKGWLYQGQHRQEKNWCMLTVKVKKLEGSTFLSESEISGSVLRMRNMGETAQLSSKTEKGTFKNCLG